MSEVRPFDPAVSKDEVDRLWRKLKDTRVPKEAIVPDAGEDYGPSIEWIHKLYNTWLSEYQWDKAAKTIGGWHHFKTNLEGLDVHFVHERARAASPSRKAIPLLLVHGWPGTFYEFSRVIAPLTDPQDSASPVFDVVVPSLPGFCWSQGPPRGWTLQDTARIFDELMRRLGYDSYAAQAGDWGHWVVRELGANFSHRCKAVHSNMCPSAPAPGEELTERDKYAAGRVAWFLGKPTQEWHMGYAIEMRTRPQTIGVAFSDNPVGIMMFVGEKYNEIVDPKLGNLQDPAFVDDILTTVCLYFFTSPSIMTSMLCYYNNVRHENYNDFNTRPENLIKSPLAVSSYPYDVAPVSEQAAARTGNLKWYKEYDHGGHFAALETPQELVEDLRDFLSKWYSP